VRGSIKRPFLAIQRKTTVRQTRQGTFQLFRYRRTAVSARKHPRGDLHALRLRLPFNRLGPIGDILPETRLGQGRVCRTLRDVCTAESIADVEDWTGGPLTAASEITPWKGLLIELPQRIRDPPL